VVNQKRRKAICFLMMDNGVEVHEIRDIKALVEKYFQESFKDWGSYRWLE